MRFKRMELSGFKSFADPVTIEFTEGITCIVGPNGSGKSNISDALRWVLGEQSPKMLRGGKMEEVIFAGTQNRKPKGMAEVTLVIDNSDHELPIEFEEVGITRRMYRSGESEYLINKIPCRLKDIRSLIMDTGIGVEGYSIIGQGRIADIIDNKMDSRREIFEEAAGIVKYRTKKEEAGRKLENAALNLERVQDIIAEIEGRIGNLKTESEKATEYLAIKDKYEKLEINIILKNIEQAKERADAVDSESLEFNAACNTARVNRDELDEQLTAARQENFKLEEEIEAIREKITGVSDEIYFITSRSQVNKERLENLVKEKDRLAADLAAIKTKLEREKENSKNTAEANKDMCSELERVSAELSEKQKAVANAQLAVINIEKEKENANLAANQKRAAIESLKLRRGKLQERKAFIEELEKSYEGYSGSVHFIMNSGLKGITGVLGDLLKVPGGWEIAIETILGAKMQNVVCADESVAKKAIALLKEKQAGRVTFLPADSITYQDAPHTDEIQGMAGYLGLASERVSLEGGFKAITEYLLNRVVVCDNLDNALCMAAKHSGPFKFVTLEGEVINPAGAITGGSLKNTTGNILSRKAEKDKLAKDIKETENQIAKQESEIGSGDAVVAELSEKLQAAKLAVDAAKAAEAQAVVAQTEARVRRESSGEIQKRVDAAIQELLAEQLQCEKDIQSNAVQQAEIESFAGAADETLKAKAAEKESLEKQVEEKSEQRKALLAQTSQLEEKRKAAESELYEMQVKVHDSEVRKARFETQEESLKEKLWDEFNLSYAEACDREDPDFVLSRAQKDAREYKDRIAQLGDVNVGAIEEYKQVSERYEFLTAQKADLVQATEELTAVIKDMDVTIKKKFKESFDLVVGNFEGTFKELFKGGTARLSMTDPENPLETSIEIEAQPPGKKLQNMNLLSGGEKTMTAIALMFAVLKSKPTPFCILDEVEAALDETNIECFARYLSNFADTQFALVTHQKVTMEYADALYGVTMPEHGVTQILSLRLDDAVNI